MKPDEKFDKLIVWLSIFAGVLTLVAFVSLWMVAGRIGLMIDRLDEHHAVDSASGKQSGRSEHE